MSSISSVSSSSFTSNGIFNHEVLQPQEEEQDEFNKEVVAASNLVAAPEAPEAPE